jgi:ParB family transcriptional regulator, chromosome partitioning protein
MDLRISLKRAFSMSSLLSGLIEDISVHCLELSPSSYIPSVHSDTSDLSRSIKQKGLLHPLIVRYAKREGHYQIITGNRRYIACKSLGWRKIPCQIIELNSDKQAFEISLIENIQRRTLNPIEEAHAFKMYVTDFGWGGVSDLANKIGKSASYVDRRLQLLELPKEVLEKVDDSELNVTAAEELIPIHDEIKQSKLAGIISRKRLSVKDVRNLIQENQNSVYAVDSNDALMQTEVKEDLAELDRRVQRSLDKSIVVFRMAMNKMLDIMQGIEDNWVIYEILLQHRNVLNAQIDLLIKQKKKIYESRF